MHPMKQSRRPSPSSRRRDDVARKPYHHEFSGRRLYSETGSNQQFMRRPPPALSGFYGRHQHTDRLGHTETNFSKDRGQQPSNFRSCNDRNLKTASGPTFSSSLTSAVIAPQSAENRNRYIHPKMVGRFVPASEVNQEKQDAAAALAKPPTDFSNGGDTTASWRNPGDTCVPALQSLSLERMTTESDALSSIQSRQEAIEFKFDPLAIEGSVGIENNSSEILFLQAIRGSLGSVDDNVDKKDDCKAVRDDIVDKKDDRGPKIEDQSISIIPQLSKKRKYMEFLPGEFKDYCKIKARRRVAVYWDIDDAYFEGTVTRQRENEKRRYFVEYDDGDREWIDFNKHRFRLLKRPAKKKVDQSLSTNDGGSYLSRSEELPSPITTGEVLKHEVSPRLKRKTHPATNSETCDVLKREINGNEMKGTAACLKDQGHLTYCDDWVLTCNNPKRYDGPGSSDDSATDDEEVMQWAAKMFGIRPPTARPKGQSVEKLPISSPTDNSSRVSTCHVFCGISEVVKRRRSYAVESSNAQSLSCTSQAKKTAHPKSNGFVCIRKSAAEAQSANDTERDEQVEAKRKKELARALTTEEIKTILDEEDCHAPCSTNWVRRSVRQPSKYALNSPRVKDLIEKLRSNDPDMVVLKMKKYVNDPNTPCLVIDAVLAALEENTNCEALYIQNFNEGMRDDQIMSLLQILQRPSCKIWCLNIGETYKVKTKTWKRFAVGLRKTKITHMYASEHVISNELKDKIRLTIRDNRSEHTMHCDPDNLDTIVKCTHCWWNPVNTKSLRPYLKKRGFDKILGDPEFQGLPGSTSAATLL